MTSGKGLYLSLFCSQPNQISTVNKAYFRLAGFELANVCAAEVGAERRKQLLPLCSSQVSGEGWHRPLGNLRSNPNQDPQVNGVSPALSPVSPTFAKLCLCRQQLLQGPAQLCLCRGAPTLAWPWRSGVSVRPIPPPSLSLGWAGPARAPSSRAHCLKLPANEMPSRADGFILFYFPKPLLRLLLSSTFC